MTGRILNELTANEIVKAVASGAANATDVTQAFLSRASSVEPSIRAWASLDPDYALGQARGIDSKPQKGPLSGVPVGVKDVFNTEFYPTEKGSPLWSGYRAGNDARCVSYLRRDDAVVLGKTDTSELAVHANGKARNPHALDRTAGSSSGGSAAAVAAGAVPVALGTQTGGSIIRPASWCGVFAMKPSFGLIPRTGVLKTTDTLDTIGFFGRSPEDLGLMLDTLRVHGSNFPIHERTLQSYAASKPARWRIGFCSSHHTPQTQTYVGDRLSALAAEFARQADIEVVDIALPPSTRRIHDVHRRIYHTDLGYYLRAEMERDSSKLSPTLRDIFEDSRTIPPEDYPVALREQTELAKEVEEFFRAHRLDAIVINSSNGDAPHTEPLEHKDVNPLWTATWVPVINVPAFRSPDGLPFGLQIVGPKFSDLKLLELLRMLSQRDLLPRRSPIANVSSQPLA